MRRAMIAEHPMRQSAVPDEFERTVEVRLKLLGRNLRVGMIADLAVYARNRLYVLKNRSDVVAHKHDGAILVYFFQKSVENALEMLVDISVRLVEKNHIGLANDGSAQQNPLNLTAAKRSDRALFQALQLHLGNNFANPLVMLLCIRTEERFLLTQPRQNYIVDRNRKLLVNLRILWQITGIYAPDFFAVPEESDSSSSWLYKPQDGLR